jgi:hypothetical protein
VGLVEQAVYSGTFARDKSVQPLELVHQAAFAFSFAFF